MGLHQVGLLIHKYLETAHYQYIAQNYPMTSSLCGFSHCHQLYISVQCINIGNISIIVLIQ